jgi:hypothetical protein
MITNSDESENKVIQQEYFTRRQRIMLLLLNYFAFFHVSLTIALVFFPWPRLWERLVAGLCGLYLLPPVLVRSIRLFYSIKEGSIAFGSRDFLLWWAFSNLQAVFCRFPSLEEVLRVVPGLYNLWLRLWGAKIGRFTYWGPGTLILDRSFLEIGNDVVFGAGVRINPHVMERNSEGQTELLLATVKIGDSAMIGGYSLLTAGTEIASRENTTAFLISPPFTKWKEGKRIKPNKGNSDQNYHRRPYNDN